MSNLKISLCIPQYNRINYLLENLKCIESQSYEDIEIVISDDCSTDETEILIKQLIPTYKYSIIYNRNQSNKGYDFNLRNSMQLATGEYCFILGNDDTLLKNDAITSLVSFLVNNDYPEIGFCNYIEDKNHSQIIERASTTSVIGKGYECALKYYRSFSFVAGVIYKRSLFMELNTEKFDGSVFVQMYFAAKGIGKGARFFTIKEPLVLKDIIIDNNIANSYRDTLPRKWSHFKSLNGGIPAVINVGVSAFSEIGYSEERVIFALLSGIYRYSYIYWLLDYRKNNSFVGACGLIHGLYPTQIIEYKHLRIFKRMSIFSIYILSTIIGIITPIYLFEKSKFLIYKMIKK